MVYHKQLMSLHCFKFALEVIRFNVAQDIGRKQFFKKNIKKFFKKKFLGEKWLL